jgi:hypothetical protein
METVPNTCNLISMNTGRKKEVGFMMGTETTGLDEHFPLFPKGMGKV